MIKEVLDVMKGLALSGMTRIVVARGRDDNVDGIPSMACEPAGSTSAKLPLGLLRNRP